MKIYVAVWGSMRRLRADIQGQDLIEYALMAGCLAAACGFFMPSVATAIGTVFSQIGSNLTNAASQG